MNVLTAHGRVGAERVSRKCELTPKHDFYCHFLADCRVMWVISPDCRPVRGEREWAGRTAASGDPRPNETQVGSRRRSWPFVWVSAPSCLKCMRYSVPRTIRRLQVEPFKAGHLPAGVNLQWFEVVWSVNKFFFFLTNDRQHFLLFCKEKLKVGTLSCRTLLGRFWRHILMMNVSACSNTWCHAHSQMLLSPRSFYLSRTVMAVSPGRSLVIVSKGPRCLLLRRCSVYQQSKHHCFAERSAESLKIW